MSNNGESRSVCHMTSVHPASDTRIFRKMCTSLARNGYSVVLIVADNALPDNVQGVEFVSVGEPSGRIQRVFFSSWRVFRAARKRASDLYHIHDPELIPWGICLRALGKKVIFDAHEDFSKQVLSKYWIPFVIRKPLSTFLRLAEHVLHGLFSACVAATPAIASNIKNKHVVVIQNYPIIGELSSNVNTSCHDEDDRLVFVGALNEVRCALELMDALVILNQNKSVQIDIIGAITPQGLFDTLTKHAGWQFVKFHGWQNRKYIAEVFQHAKAGLVLFKPEPNHINAQPNKLFEYMSAGLPVIASDFPEWRKIVCGERVGTVVDPLDPQAIAAAIETVLNDKRAAVAMSERARVAVLERYNWKTEEDKLFKLYEDLLCE